ncbi:hypothetical protein FCJ61_39350 [Burkholderia metallica]|uniref:hypothetical protein n=1 Tax=Burkholderia metallica TaxID=488729 RepID=UPI00157A67CA|nr:hypothetical protein [Burkholderia metallica]NTZ88882.1 hypothetical protein [Burkholderia metallica]
MLALACVTGTVHASSMRCDKEPFTAKRVTWLARDVEVGRMRLRVADVLLVKGADATSETFRAFWEREGVPTKSTRAGGRMQLSALDNACQYLLDMPADTADRLDQPVEARFSVMAMRDVVVGSPSFDGALPLPEGKSLSVVISHDPLSDAKTVVIRLNSAPVRAAHAYLRRLREDGWSITKAIQMAAGPGGSADRVVLAMQKTSFRLDATFMQGKSAGEAVINISKDY